ncbi:uncharacterized protein LOC141855717 isoform X2 [Brevipalpus obovatus]|uniref:uncharacterized protein LOC141855717 isoform X2 n=1 Tax=Brevipalpus obovatus TaxID=246614 RepID=UPI003D9E7770
MATMPTTINPSSGASTNDQHRNSTVSRKSFLDGPYIPIFECRTGSATTLIENRSPPPRPPKPACWKMRSKSESCSSLPSCSFVNDNNRVNAYDASSHNDKHNSRNLEFAYDFPRNQTKPSPSVYSLRTPVPVRNTTAKSTLSYDNGVQVCRNKAEIFTYDYLRPILPNFEDGSHLNFASETLDRSPQPSTPSSAHDSLSSNGSYSKSSTPPAVNRDLKPRRKGSDSDANSPASPTFKLSPPPTSQANHIQSRAHLGKPRSRQSLNNRDLATITDDFVNSSTISRRNPSHDEQSLRSHSVPRKTCDPNSVTYLDLDLDADSKSTQKSSNFHHFKSDSMSSTFKNNNPDSQSSNPSQSTVYKTIDFVATDAFRRLRIGVDNSHRSREG